MKTATKKFTKKKSYSKNAIEDKKNPFLEMIIQGLEDLKQENWEHYLKYQIDFTPKNLFSKLPYHSFNRFTLMLDMMIGGFSSPYYATFNQISQAGGVLKKGSKGRVLQYFNYIIKHKISENKFRYLQNVESTAKNDYIVSSFVKYFRVFNSEFIENMEDIKIDIQNNDEDLSDLNEVIITKLRVYFKFDR